MSAQETSLDRIPELRNAAILSARHAADRIICWLDTDGKKSFASVESRIAAEILSMQTEAIGLLNSEASRHEDLLFSQTMQRVSSVYSSACAEILNGECR